MPSESSPASLTETDLAVRAFAADGAGSLFGIVCLALLTPALGEVALSFGAFEFFWLALFGVMMSGTIAGTDPIKGWLMGFAGLFLVNRITGGRHQLSPAPPTARSNPRATRRRKIASSGRSWNFMTRSAPGFSIWPGKSRSGVPLPPRERSRGSSAPKP